MGDGEEPLEMLTSPLRYLLSDFSACSSLRRIVLKLEYRCSNYFHRLEDNGSNCNFDNYRYSSDHWMMKDFRFLTGPFQDKLVQLLEARKHLLVYVHTKTMCEPQLARDDSDAIPRFFPEAFKTGRMIAGK